MEKKKTDIQFVWATSLSYFSLVILYPAGHHFFLLFPLLSIFYMVLSGSFFIKTRYVFIYSAVVFLTTFAILKIKALASVNIGVPMDCVSSISGYVIYDSSFTKSNNNFMTIFITQAKSIYGQTVSARGLVNVIGDERAIITSGIKISLYGRFTESFFKYQSLQVLSRSQINNIREFLIVEIEKRLLSSQSPDASLLSIMLLLGRSDSYNQTIKQLAQESGCSHVLALSGMHLNSITTVFKPIKNKKLKYVLSLIISFIFVFIAGPRPSLIRAFLMLMFSFLPKTEKLVVSFIAQLILFPFSIINTGCIYSYLAIFALSYLTPVLQQSVPMPKTIKASACVLLLIAPVEIITTQQWNIWALLASPIVGVLIVISMFLGLLILVFGQINILTTCNNYVYNLLVTVFEKFSLLPKSGWNAYIIFAGIMLFLILFVPLKKLILTYRFKKINKTHIIKL